MSRRRAVVTAAVVALAAAALLPAWSCADESRPHDRHDQDRQDQQHHTRQPERRSHGADSRAAPRATASRLFAADSVWNTPLSADAPLDPSSSARMAAFRAEIRRELAAHDGPSMSTAGSTTIYTVPADQRRVPVTLDTGPWGNTLAHVLSKGVPIPAHAITSTGSDRHLTIYQPSTDTLWEFWHAVKEGDGWHASWGGAMRDVSQNPGYYTSRVWPGLAPRDGWHWGATATSLPVAAGDVRITELRRGHIDHALAMNIPDACKDTFSWPAQRSDGSLTTPDCLPEGAHLRLDPSLDLSRLDLPPITRMLAEAAQRYGLIVRDITHEAVGFAAESPAPTGTSPYYGPDGLFGGLAPYQFMPKFPWGHLQLLKMTLCSDAPCQPAG